MSATLFGGEEKKEKSLHRQLIEFFSDTALRFRGFRPVITPQDAVALKKALTKDILDQSHWEQIILYFLADRSFKNLSPSIYTMLSGIVLNGLRNKAINREQFYKEIEVYQAQYVGAKETKKVNVGMVSLADKLKELQDKMSKRKEVQG